MSELAIATDGRSSAVTARQAYANTRAGNYCTLPTRDVPILQGTTPRCRTCNQGLRHVAPATPARAGDWEHHSDSDHRPAPQPICIYCGANDGHVTFRQHAWHDAIECDRCGGVNGWPVGD